jgi:23S rRNA (pseudouridine1915-N3)-methyltransferase
MRLVVAAVGRLKDDAERVLLDKYQARFEGIGKRLGIAPVTWHQIGESRAASAAKRKSEEGAALLRAVRDADPLFALDVQGQALSSEKFAKLMAETRDGGARLAAILVGGPDGLAPEVLAGARRKISFGAITLPHGLARIVLAEQLYRAATILAGHPYHRG